MRASDVNGDLARSCDGPVSGAAWPGFAQRAFALRGGVPPCVVSRPGRRNGAQELVSRSQTNDAAGQQRVAQVRVRGGVGVALGSFRLRSLRREKRRTQDSQVGAHRPGFPRHSEPEGRGRKLELSPLRVQACSEIGLPPRIEHPEENGVDSSGEHHVPAFARRANARNDAARSADELDFRARPVSPEKPGIEDEGRPVPALRRRLGSGRGDDDSGLAGDRIDDAFAGLRTGHDDSRSGKGLAYFFGGAVRAQADRANAASPAFGAAPPGG